MSSELLTLSSKEQEFRRWLSEIKKLAWRNGETDFRLLRDRQKRLQESSAKETKLIQAEIKDDEKKIKLKRAIIQLEHRLESQIQQFDNLIRSAVDSLRRSAHPIDARPYLMRSKQILEEIAPILQQIKELENRLARLSKHEQKLLNKEAKTV